MFARRAGKTNRLAWFGVGALIGIVGMYFLDPNQGRRRRVLATDKARRLRHQSSDFIVKQSRDLSNRARGAFYRASAALRSSHVDDDKLTRRVASQIGRVVGHPRSLGITAEDGIITLRGPILASEVHRLLSTVRGISGVQDIQNELEVHQSAEHIPGLQGESRYQPV